MPALPRPFPRRCLPDGWWPGPGRVLLRPFLLHGGRGLLLRPRVERRSTLAQRQRAFDDLPEHRPGLAALCRPMRDPDRGVVLGEDVGEVALALDAERRE